MFSLAAPWRVRPFLAAAFLITFLPLTALAENAFRDDADIPSANREALNSLLTQGVVRGNDDGTFAPQRQLNRAEVSKIIVLATNTPLRLPEGAYFPDVSPDDWFYPYVETMRHQGWIAGYPDGLFRPGQGINRAEAAKMLVNAFDLSSSPDTVALPTDVKTSDWYYPYVNAITQNQVMPLGVTKRFNPGSPLNRIDTVQFAYNAQRREQVPVLEAGTLKLAVSDTSPKAGPIPKNGSRLPFLTLDLTAQGGSEIVINALTFERQGLGARTQIDKVWLEDSSGVLSQKRSLDSKDKVEFILNPVITVPRQQTRAITVYANLREGSAGGVGTTHRFILKSMDQVGSSAQQVTANFPLSGNTMQLVDYVAPQLSFTVRGTAGTVKVGDRQKEIGAFSLENPSRKNLNLVSLTLENKGTTNFDDDLTNLKLVDGSGVVVASGEILKNNRVKFNLGNRILTAGDRLNLTVLADALRAQVNSNVILRLKSAQDLVATEKTSGYSAAVVNATGTAVNNLALKTYTIQSGQLTITQEPYSLGNLSYAPGAKAATLLSTRFTLTVPIETQGLNVRLDSSSRVVGANGQTLSGASALTALKEQVRNYSLYVNDRRVGTSSGWLGTSLSDASLNFKDAFEIPAVANVRVVADISPQAQVGTRLKFNVAGTDLINPEYSDTGKAVVGSSILGRVASHFTTVEVSRLRVVRTDGYGERSAVVMGGSNLELMRFVLDNNDVGAVELSQLRFKMTGSGNAKTTGMTLRLQANNRALGKTKAVGADNLVVFEGLNLAIGSGDDTTISVVADTFSQSQAKANEELTSPSQAVASVSLNLSSASGLAKGDRLRLTPRLSTSSTGGLVGQTPVYVTVQSFAGSQANVSGSNFPAPTQGNPGTTRFKGVDASAVSDQSIVRLVETANSQVLCSVEFAAASRGVLADSDCADKVAVLTMPDAGYTDETELWQAVKTLRNVSGYNLSVNDAEQELNLIENLPPYVAGNLRVEGSAASAFSTTNVTVGQATRTLLVALVSEMRLELTEVVAQNADAGSPVQALTGSGSLVSASNPVVSTMIEAVDTGAVVVHESSASLFEQKIIHPGVAANLMALRFNSVNDEVDLRELHLINDADGDGQADAQPSDSFTVRVVNDQGQVLKERLMAGGKVSFNFTSSEAPRFKRSQSQTLWIQALPTKVGPAQSGAKLRLRLAQNMANGGLHLVGASNGESLATPTSGWVVSSGSGGQFEFVLHKSALTLRHAPTQPRVVGPNSTSQEVYRFQVQGKQADAELARVSLQLDLQGMRRSGGVPFVAEDVRVYPLNASGAIANQIPIGTVQIDGGNTTAQRLRFSFNWNQPEFIISGQSRNFALYLANTEDLGGASDDDAVAISWIRDSISGTGQTLAAQKGASARVIWSDLSASPHTGSTADWFNGAGLLQDGTGLVNRD